jgi:hypothetical protein
MTILTPLPPLSVIDALRGDRSSRPAADMASASGLRAQLEDGIYEIVGNETPSSPLVVRASSLRHSPRTTDLSTSAMARMRGVLVSHLLRLLCVGFRPDSNFDSALDAWRGDAVADELLEQLDRLDGEERARLATDVTAHGLALSRALGEVPSRWMPRSALRASQRLGGGRVILRDVVDLMVGTNGCGSASVALFDVTTSPLAEGAERSMRYHALVETLRSSVVPLRTSTLSTATGELWTLDVDHAMLQRSADEVLEVLNEMWCAK